MVGGGVHRRGRAPLSGVVEAVLSARDPEVGAVAAQDHGAAHEAEAGADPAGVQGEAERHQTLVQVSADGEPDGGDDAAHSCRGPGHRGEKISLYLPLLTGSTRLLTQEAGQDEAQADRP